MPFAPASSRRSNLLAAACALCAPVATAGCATDEITVVVCGDAVVPNDLDAVRVELLDARLEPIRGGVDVLVDDAGGVTPLPIRPTLEAPSGPGWVRVIGLANQVRIFQFDRQISQFDDVETVEAPLVRACLGSFCEARGQTCVAGSCQVAPFEGEPPGCEAAP